MTQKLLNQETGAYLTDEEVIVIALALLQHQFKNELNVSTPKQAKDFIQLSLNNLEHEVFVCVFLTAQHNVITIEEMFRGTLTQTSVYPREVVKTALRHNCGAVIFAHNHPSGATAPSEADRSLTRALAAALTLVDVRVLDHFIVGRGQILSFAEEGLL